MVFGANACCLWSSNSWVEFWTFHYFSLLPLSFP
ncbi:hypothetical protein OROMI_028447 [Orobanche minor]